MKRGSFIARLDLLENWRIKLAAIFIAILFWFAVVTEGEFEYEVDVPLVATDIPRGKTLVEPLPEVARVRVEGKGKALLALLFYRDARLNIDCSGIHRSKRVAVVPQMIQSPRRGGDLVAQEILYPDSVWIRLSPLASKQVQVVPVVSVLPVAGYTLASPMTIRPDSVLVEGPEEAVGKIDRIYTEKQEITGFKQAFRRELALVAPLEPPGLRLFASRVELFADVQKLIEVTLKEIPVEVRNVPEAMRVMVIPSTTTLTLDGGERLLLELKREDIQVYIDYERAKREPQANGHVAYISLPAGINYNKMTPERFALSFEKITNHATARD